MAYTTIDKPTDYFNTVLYTGNAVDGSGTTQSVTGVGFQPDLVWIKSRSATKSHYFFDVIRGVTKQLNSNNANAENTGTTSLTAFGSDGFTLGSEPEVNEQNTTFASWNWLAGGTASSNTDGDITSTVSANTTAGFSIVSYTGTDVAGDTVGHGLNAVPKWILVKRLVGSGYDWVVYHANDTAGLYLNSTGINNDSSANAIWFNGTAPTSSVFSIGTDGRIGDATSYIAYCFAEKKGFSKFGSYTSINSHDSTFVHLGFKPAMIIFKNTSYGGGSDWNILDRTRYTFNSSSEAVLEPNTSDAENYSAFGEVDFLSNGFKIRNNNGVSSGGYDHIYMAFAESPFVTSTGIPTTAR